MKTKKFKLTRKNILITIIALAVIVSFAVPTLSRFVNLGLLPSNLPVWDGSVASSYSSGTGSKEDPYLIDSGAQLAYFSTQLKDTDYKDIYFKLDNDIILNEGYFTYKDDMVQYTLNEITYYIKNNTNEVYEDSQMTILSDVKVNIFDNFDKFAGELNGSFNSIYGLYITEEKQTAIFDNLSGNIKNLFIENIIVTGKDNVAGLALNADDLSLENIYINGSVSTYGELEEVSQTIELDDVNFTTNLTGKSFGISKNILENYEIISSRLTGDYVVSDETDISYELKINNNIVDLGKIDIDLENVPLDEVMIEISEDATERNISLINLKYEVVYKSSTSSALINNANNVNVNSVVTDVFVHNQINSNGFISNAIGNINVTNSYNLGLINGLVNSNSFIDISNEATINIDKVYNDGQLNNSSSMINTISKNSVVNIKNSFNNTNGLIIATDKSKNTILDNVYNTTEEENIQLINDPTSKEMFDTLTLGDYNKDEATEDDIWIYNEYILPELFFINEINLIDIRVGENSWNKLSLASNNVFYSTDELTVAVTSSAYVYSLEKVEYFVKIGDTPFEKEELETVEWSEYNGGIKLTEEGKYIVYVKLTSYDGKVKHMNTDVINIDTSNPEISMQFSDKIWDSYRKDVKEVYMEENDLFKINASDGETGIKEVSYYLSNELISEEELKKLNDANWTTYNSEFSITPVGNNILYARAIDNSGNISFLNSDIITFDGYFLNSIKAGRNDLFDTTGTLNITAHSSVVLNYIYNIPSQAVPAAKHHLVFNKFFPQGTVIIISDNITGQKYDYEIDANNVRSIPFESFNLIGTLDSYYTERDYDNGTNIAENFTITFNFENAIVTGDFSYLAAWIELRDDSNTTVRETNASSITNFNIFDRSDAQLYFNSTTSSIYIKHNADSIYNVNINTGINYAMYGNKNIYDTYIEEQNIVMRFKLYDDFDETVPRNQLTNLMIKIDDKEYYPNEDGEFIVSLKTGIQQINKTMEIYAYKGDTFLAEGRYKLEMVSYISYNEHETDYYAVKEIPFTVTHTAESSNMVFKADMTNDAILSKDSGLQTINITSLLSGLENPNIRISLYKKNEQNAVDQGYTMINLDDYTESILTSTSEANKYLVDSSNYNFDLNLSLLDKQAYKLVIESYSNDEKISSIEKSFIIK